MAITIATNPDAKTTSFVGFKHMDHKDHRHGNDVEQVSKEVLRTQAKAWYDVKDSPLTNGAAKFESGNSEYLSITDAAQVGLDITGSFTIAAWVMVPDAGGLNRSIVGKFESAGNQRSYRLYQISSNTWRFGCWEDGTNATARYADLTDFAADSWHYVVGVYDGVNVQISVNGSALTVGQACSGVYDGSGGFAIGGINATPIQLIDGEITHATLWSRALTSGEIATLYNGGIMRGYTDSLAADANLANNLVSWWELNEASGDRYDSHGTNTLTDNNTVQQGRLPLQYTPALPERAVRTGSSDLKTDLVRKFEEGNSEFLRWSNHDLDWTGEMAVSAWLKVDAFDGTLQWPISTGGGGATNNGISIRLQASNVLQPTWNAHAAAVTSGTASGAISTGTWYHILYQRRAGQIQFFLDGVQVGSDVAEAGDLTPDSQSHIDLGAFVGASHKYTGQMAHVCIKSGASFSSSEITALYNGGTPLTPDQMAKYQSGGVSYWPLNEPRGDAYDLWGSNTLTSNNTVQAATGPVEYIANPRAGVTKWLNAGGAASLFGDLADNGTAGQEPILNNGILNFVSGTSAGLKTAVGTTSAPSSVFMVAAADSGGPALASLFDSAAASDRIAIYLASDVLTAASDAGGLVSTTESLHTEAAIYVEAETDDIRIRVGGTQYEGSGNVGDMDGIVIGAAFGNIASASWSGTVKVCLVFDRNLTEAEIDYLTDLYS